MTRLAPSLALPALATPSALAAADVIEVAAPTGDPDLDRASVVEALG